MTTSPHDPGNETGPRSGGAAAVATLAANGVDTLYCLPGIQNDHFFNALHDHNATATTPIRTIQTRHEQGAGYMALGHAMATGEIAAFSVVPGPGILNATAALATAYAVNARVLCLTGQLPTSAIGRQQGALHEIENQLEIIDSLTKWSARAEHADEVIDVLQAAFTELRSGRPRPVGVELPMDVLPATTTAPDPPPATGRDDTDVNPATIDRVASLLAEAERPMILVGGGAHGVSAEVTELAERLQAPVVAYRTGKGVVDGRNPLSMFHPPAERYWKHCDVAIGIGTNMRIPLQKWATTHTPSIVHVDVDPTTHDRIRPPDVAITARAEDVMAPLLAALDAAGHRRLDPAQRPAEIDEANAWWREASSVLEPQLSYLAAIREGMGEHGVFVDELTQVGYVSRIAFEVYEPRTFLSCGYQGTLGYGFPTALGAKVARPDVPVVSIAGDGGFLFTVQELATAVQHRIGVVVVVFDNSAYGNVQMMQRADHGGRVIATDLVNPDFVALAEAFGAVGIRATSPDEVAAAIRSAEGRDLPTVVHAPIGDVPSVDRFR